MQSKEKPRPQPQPNAQLLAPSSKPHLIVPKRVLVLKVAPPRRQTQRQRVL
jgi:hypothetical protein